jgi:hypothetical protein
LESNPRVLGKAKLYILKKYILSSKKRDTKMSLVFLPKKKQIILDFVPPFLLNTVKKKTKWAQHFILQQDTCHFVLEQLIIIILFSNKII